MGGVYLEGVSDGRRQGWLLFRTRGRLPLLSPGCWRRRPGAGKRRSGVWPDAARPSPDQRAFPEPKGGIDRICTKNRKEEGSSWIKARGV